METGYSNWYGSLASESLCKDTSSEAKGGTKLIAGISVDAPQLTLDVESPLNMAQLNGLFKEQTSPDGQRNGSLRLANSQTVHTGELRAAIGTPSYPINMFLQARFRHPSTPLLPIHKAGLRQ